MKNPVYIHFILLIFVLISVSCNPKKPTTKNNTQQVSKLDSTYLFNGVDLEDWEITEFGTNGPVYVSDGKIVITYGDGCSGITWKGEFPTVDYEVSLEAKKTTGNDFFCGMTFPVNNEFCSLIVGGWGGPVVGLSCIDGLDASENETNTLKRFDRNVWYKIRLQVTAEKIVAWIDDEKMVDFSYTGRELYVRPEVELSKPFGICTWLTTAELKNIRLQELD